MPGSFLSRHRTICATLDELRELVTSLKDTQPVLVAQADLLLTEAKTYAQSMSAKLLEYKLAKEQTNDQGTSPKD